MSDITKKPLKLSKYFDDNYQREYYHNHETGESLWEIPDGYEVEIIDCIPAPEVAGEKAETEEKKETEIERRIKEYKAEMSKFDQ